jgi:hypothetical protein
MKAVGRLLVIYFAGTPAMKWLTLSGLLLMLAALYVVLFLPQTQPMTAFAFAGIITFFLGTSLMPLTFGQLMQGHHARLLPGMRVKLLISAILTVLLVALPVGLMTPLAYVAGMSADVGTLFEYPSLLGYTLWLALYTYSSACIAAIWLYIIIWFVTSDRSAAGYSRGVVVLLIFLLVPAAAQRFIPGDRLSSALLHLAALGFVFSVALLGWPWLKRRCGGASLPRNVATERTRDFAGREVDVLLGNSRPWILVVMLLLPLLFTLRNDTRSAAFWLLYFSIAGVVVGGSTERILARSRTLWLRTDWSRAALFDHIERSVWRHNGIVVVALLLLQLGVAAFTRMPAMQLFAAIALLCLGTSLGTYLGLSLTRGIRLVESIAGIIVMAALMVVAAMAANPEVDRAVLRTVVIAALVAMAVLVLVLRTIARGRWARIDWSQCRREPAAVARAG